MKGFQVMKFVLLSRGIVQEESGFNYLSLCCITVICLFSEAGNGSKIAADIREAL